MVAMPVACTLRVGVASEPVRSVTVGLRGHGANAAVASPPGALEVLTLALATLRDRFPAASCTSMQVNAGFSAMPHIDAANIGDSYCVGLGDYSGGALWIEDGDGSSDCVMPLLQGSVAHLSHRAVRGREWDVRRLWTVIPERGSACSEGVGGHAI